MPDSNTPTIHVGNDEVKILSAIRRFAPTFNVSDKQAEIYGVWTICYHRFCQKQDIPLLWMQSVSDFMDFLDANQNLTPAERNQALDAVMFYLNDVRRASDEAELDEVESFARPSTPRSLFGHLLLRCNIEVDDALTLRVSDVDLDNANLRVTTEDATRIIDLLPSLRAGMRAQIERAKHRAKAEDPLLFDADSSSDPATIDFDPDEAVHQATQAATRVMKTFDDAPDDDESEDNNA